MTELEKQLAFTLMVQNKVNLSFRSNRVEARRSVKGSYTTVYFKHHPDKETATAVAILEAMTIKGD